MNSQKKRIDLLLVEQGLVPSRTRAQALIRAGVVYVQKSGELQQVKASNELFGAEKIEVKESELERFVSRAGLKLSGALDHLGLAVRDFCVLDVGISTGGFADCVLQRGAAKVVGVEVGHGQLAEKLKSDSRVTCFEDLNVRDLANHSEFLSIVPAKGFDLVVVDVSFISLTKVLPVLIPFARAFLCLVKPQFEVGPQGLGKGGVVKDPSQFLLVESKIKELARQLGLQVIGYFPSSIEGKDGNQEFFIYGSRCSSHGLSNDTTIG